MNLTDPRALAGTWRFDRHIDDRAAGQHHTATGVATFVVEDATRVRWDESGVVRWGGDGEGVPITRTLLLDRREEGWIVLFEDGREFHPWSPGGQVRHPCGDDVYTGCVSPTGQAPDGWTVEWRAAGPTKDYTVTTVLSRSSGSDPR
jgi:hypothetical protein|nr:hypothetical protein [Aeromicrobium sp.]